MSINTYYNKVVKLEKDISDIQKKIADETKKEVDKQKQIDAVSRSVTNSTPISTIQSKQRQIQGFQNDIIRIQSTKADFHKKIAEKTRDLVKAKQELQKEEIKEKEKLQKEQEVFRSQQEGFQKEQKQFQYEQEQLQRKIQSEITKQKDILDTLIHQNHSAYFDSNLNEQKEYDFFISHATEDKEGFVRPLAMLLEQSGYKVWYDEFQLKIGDSLRKKIDEGLRLSKYGIVVLSRDFFRKNWTEYELNGLVAKEMNGIKVILPIWHNVTKDEVLSFSLTLADKVALNTAIYSFQEIAIELGKLISK